MEGEGDRYIERENRDRSDRERAERLREILRERGREDIDKDRE